MRGNGTRRSSAVPTRWAEDHFDEVVSGVRDYAIFLLDPTGHIASWNTGAERIKGYTAREALGRHFSIFYPPEVDRGWPDEELRIATRQGRFEHEGWRVRKDGSRFWANVVITALPDERGALRGFLKITRDLTERKETEEALRASEERFRTLVEKVSDFAIFMVDPEGRVMTWNDGAERIEGYTSEEILGRKIDLCYTPEDVAAGKPRAELETAIREGVASDEGWRLRKDGTRFWAHVVTTLLKDPDGRTIGFVKVTRDLTEPKRAEGLLRQRADQMRGLAAEVARTEQRERLRLAQALHDTVQQSLVAARMKLAQLRKSLTEERSIEAAAELEDLIGETAESARSLSVDLSPPVLRDAGLAKALHWLGRRTEEKHEMKVRVRAVDRDEPLSKEIRYVLFEAVRELLLNAVKHAGTTEAKVALARLPGPRVQVTVEDTGSGFDARALEEAEKTGFGLLHVRERVEALGGIMEIDAAPGRGTRIGLTVPDIEPALRPETMREPATGEVPIHSPAARGPARIRVLVVDDHRILRQGLVGLLREDPVIDVIGEASNGEEAIEKNRALRPDVIIMDVSMPRMNGIEATQHIKREDRRVAVIGLSLYKEKDIERSMMEAGACRYLTKDGPSDDLLSAIRGCAPRL